MKCKKMFKYGNNLTLFIESRKGDHLPAKIEINMKGTKYIFVRENKE